MPHARFRRQRVALLSVTLWKRRLVFLFGAIVVSLASVAFAKAADGAGAFFQFWSGDLPYLPLVVTPLGYAFCAWCVAKYFPGAQGSGIPQAIAARATRDLDHRQRLLGLRVAVGKVLLTTVALAVGASVGREGPTVQIGASVMLIAASFAGIAHQRGFVLAGAAAGIAAAFNTPLAGVVFAIEEMARAFERRITGLVITAVLVAGVTSLALLGSYQYFGGVASHLGEPRQWLAVPVCGVVGGVLGGLFSRGVIGLTFAREGFFGRLKARPFLFAAGCGLLVAALGLVTAGFATGSGYDQTRAVLEGEGLLPWYYGLAKLLTTLVSSACGIAGGLFSPSLAVGASLAALVEPILPDMPLGALGILAMVAYFAGVVQAPLTAFVIVFEMTSDTRMVVPLMATSLLAAGVSRLVSAEPLYHTLARGFTPRAVAEERQREKSEV